VLHHQPHSALPDLSRIPLALGSRRPILSSDQATTNPGAVQVDVEAVARMLCIWSDVEFIQQGEDEGEEYLHLPAEVLLIDRRQAFPWQLMDPFEWARELELKDFWRYWH